MSNSWNQLAEEILHKIRSYTQLTDGWQICQKKPDVTVWHRPSPDWKGTLYKAEGTINASPETVFSFVDPSPKSTRCKWDKAIKELQLVEQIDKNISVMRTLTHSAFGGLISARDFVDLVVNETTPDYISTNARWTEHPKCPATSEATRGTNHPCAIICNRISGQPNKTLVTTYIQTDLGGYLPTSLVDSALPGNQVQFFSSLATAIKEHELLQRAG